MKFQGYIDIQKPRELVVKLFQDPDNLGEWQDGFQKIEHVSGEKGAKGSVSMLYYVMNNRPLELKETIVENNLPDAFEAFYEHKHMDNTMKCSFSELSDSSTRYSYEFEYTRFGGFMPKMMSIFFPGMFKKQGEKWMRQFKEFVEAM